MNNCELCDRYTYLQSHHLIPREIHSKKWCIRLFSKEEMNRRRAMLCNMCHKAIHRFFSNQELGKEYNTIDKLKTNDKVVSFTTWCKKQKI